MRKVIIAAVAALAAAGCGGKDKEAAEPQGMPAPQGETTTGGETGAEATQAATSAACPMKVQGTTVQAENVEGGAALIFMTTGDVDDLRERVRHFAAMQEAEGMRGGQVGMTGPMRPGGGDVSAGAKTDEPMSDEQRGDGVMGGVEAEEEWQAMGGGESGGKEATPQINTRVEDIEGGARMVIIPMDSGDLDDVRMHVEEQAQTMTSGQCPAMSSSSVGMDTGMYPEE